MRRYTYPAAATAASRISSICCVCEKSSARCFCLRHRPSTFMVTICFPLRSALP